VGAQSFKKTSRILTPRDFAVFKTGATKLFGASSLTFLLKPSKGAEPRLGIVVSRSKRAVDRNWYKRRIREYFRTHKEKFQTKDLLVLVRDLGAHVQVDRKKRRQQFKQELASVR